MKNVRIKRVKNWEKGRKWMKKLVKKKLKNWVKNRCKIKAVLAGKRLNKWVKIDEKR